MIRIILNILLVSSVASAQVTPPSPIAKGSPSPVDGYVITKDTEQKIRTDLTYKDLQISNLAAQNKVQNDMLEIDAKQIKLYEDQVNSTRELSTLEKMGYFALGAVLTGMTAYATVKAAGR